MLKLTKREEELLEGYCECIPIQQLKQNLGRKKYRHFTEWMYGQTFPLGGVYTYDLLRYLKGLKVID